MAFRQIDKKDIKDTTNCPRCGGEAIFIDGKMIKWLTCTKCKYKKVIEKEEEPINFIPLKSDEDAKKIFKI